jgi:hypothetical protein
MVIKNANHCKTCNKLDFDAFLFIPTTPAPHRVLILWLTCPVFYSKPVNTITNTVN